MRVVWLHGSLVLEPQSPEERAALLVIYEGFGSYDGVGRRGVPPIQPPQEGGADDLDVQNLVAFAKRQQAVGLREVEKMCDELCAGDAKSDYGIGYQNAMKEISVHCEQKAKEREG